MRFIFPLLLLVWMPAAFAQHASDLEIFYDEGINFKYDPAFFFLKFQFRLQNRAIFEEYENNSTDQDKISFLARRVRLKLDGYLYDKSLIYKIQLAFSRDDMDWDKSNFPNILRDAAVGWHFTHRDTLYAGLMKAPGNRQRVISSGRQEFVDRSLANATFNIDRDIGIQLWHRFSNARPWWLKLALTNGQGRGNSNKDTGLAFTSRLEWLALGSFKDSGDYYEGDIAFEETPKISLGIVHSTNEKATREGGQIGLDIKGNQRRNLESTIGDFLIKYRGWSLSAEYFRRNVDIPQIDATQTLFDGVGYNVQTSYVFRNMYSPAARWTRIAPDKPLRGLLEARDQYTLAMSKYFKKHAIKLQGDVTYEKTTPYIAQSENNWIYRLQFELGL